MFSPKITIRLKITQPTVRITTVLTETRNLTFFVLQTCFFFTSNDLFDFLKASGLEVIRGHPSLDLRKKPRNY